MLSPRIIGSRVKLSPARLMFALFAFGWLLGFIGLLVAIPLAAAIGVVPPFTMRRVLRRALATPVQMPGQHCQSLRA